MKGMRVEGRLCRPTLAKVRTALILVTGVMASVAYAVDCRVCEVKRSKLQHLQAQQAETTDLLGKNNAYLAVLSSRQASKFLKVNSNIQQILKKLDLIKKDTERAESDYTDSGCLSCGGPAQASVPAGERQEKPKPAETKPGRELAGKPAG